MGTSQSKNTETINWNNINTDDMNSEIPGMKGGLSHDAKLLLTKINLPEISETNSDFDLGNILNTEINSNNVFTNLKNNNKDLTDSPFISSDMYNYLLNKRNTNNNINTNILKGGKGDDIDDEESTSSTSSNDNKDIDSEDGDIEDVYDDDIVNTEDKISDDIKKQKKHKKDKKDKKNTNKTTQLKNKNKEIDIVYNGKRKTNKTKKAKKNTLKESENYLSYISSSAHTGKSISGSILNENNYTISSINTSDINMISE
jgi:hypothetical protein